MLGYDDVVSVDYFGDHLKGWYLEKHTILEALEYTFARRAQIDAKLAAEDEKLKHAAAAYGEEYYHILVASLRQSVAAHKLVRDREGNLLFCRKSAVPTVVLPPWTSAIPPCRCICSPIRNW